MAKRSLMKAPSPNERGRSTKIVTCIIIIMSGIIIIIIINYYSKNKSFNMNTHQFTCYQLQHQNFEVWVHSLLLWLITSFLCSIFALPLARTYTIFALLTIGPALFFSLGPAPSSLFQHFVSPDFAASSFLRAFFFFTVALL